MTEQKGRSPFYPGQPVPVELFVGRKKQIDRILRRGAAQVSLGKPIALFVQGEYGIGKSSIAQYAQAAAQIGGASGSLYGIYAPLGGAKTIQDVAAIVLEATIQAGAYEHTRSEKIRNWLGKYIGEQTLFGVKINLAALEQDAPSLATPFGMLRFLTETLERLRETGTSGIFIVLDEINGIASEPSFAQFIKALVDANSAAPQPLPLLLMLCGAQERRRDMIRAHQSVDRVFDIVEIERMNDEEMTEFFTHAFESVKMSITPEAVRTLSYYSAGYPKIMHILGDCAFWEASGSEIDPVTAQNAVMEAAAEVGKRFVDQQVLAALRSPAYRSILDKIAQLDLGTETFTRADVSVGLTDDERGKLDSFLRKMVQLNVIRKGDAQGEYIFNLMLVRLYLWLRTAGPPR